MLVFRLVLRALRWRAGASVTVFVVAVIGVLSATVGPIYLRATDQVVLTERLQQTPQNQRDVMVAQDSYPAVAVDPAVAVNEFAGRIGNTKWFGPPVVADQAPTKVFAPNHLAYTSRLVAIDGQCRHLAFTAGRCPTAPTETAISARDAQTGRWRVGDTVAPDSLNEALPVRLKIVGVYQPLDEAGTYWGPWQFFDFAGTMSDTQLPKLDTFFVDQTTLDARITTIRQTIAADVPLLVGKVELDDRKALRAAVLAVQHAAVVGSGTNPFTQTKVTTQLVQRLNDMNHEMSLAGTLVTLATVQLALLAICVLYAIVAATASVHGPEVALAKLRGRRPVSILGQGLLEPVLLVVMAAVAGAALAWLVVRLIGPGFLGRDAVVTFPRSAVVVAALTTAAAVLASAVAARRIVVSPISALLRRGGEAAGPSTGLAIADAAAVTLAVAGLIELAVGGVLTAGKPDPLSVLAPTLLAVAVAVLGLRLLPYGGRAVVAWTRESRHLVPFLAVRQIVRRSTGTRLVLLIAIALALATFAVTNWSVGRSNRQIRALNDAGAARVLTVLPKDGVDIQTAVDAADPGGHAAMAAALMVGSTTPLLAVDTTRMTGIAEWRRDYSSASLSKIIAALRPATQPSVLVTGSQLRLDVALVDPVGAADPLALGAGVVGPDHRLIGLDLGTMRPGRSSYQVTLPPSCARGCRLTRFTVTPRGAQAASVASIEVLVHGATVASATAGPWRPVAGLTDPNRWRGDGVGALYASARAGALDVSFEPESAGGQWPTLMSDDVPAKLPAVLAPQTSSVYAGPDAHDVSVTGLDGTPLSLDGSLDARTLPQFDRTGAMVDLGLAELAMTQSGLFSARYEVWLSGSAPADMTQRLQSRGLQVTGTDDATRYRATLDHTGPAFADSLFVVAAAAATFLAIGATVLGGLVTARRRSYELAALEAVGVAPRSLRRATAAEQGLLLAVGLVLGVLAGVGGAVLALPSTPFFVSTAVGPPVEHGLPGRTLAGLCGALVVVLAVTCFAVARLVEGQATASRLREQQQ